jgi:hypothetical protein
MGGFTSLASTAMQALSLANTAVKGIDAYRDDSGTRAYQQAKQQSALGLATLQEKTALQKEQNRLVLEQDSVERQERLRAALAKQRALYGGRGVGSDGGSSQAYLLGLVGKNEDESNAASETTLMRNKILDQEYDGAKARNMLELTQMKEKSKLKKAAAAYNSLTSVF